MRIGRALGQAAEQDPRPERAGQVREGFCERAGQVGGRIAEARDGAAVQEHLRQGDQTRIASAGLPDESRGAVQVRGHVLIRGQLDEGYSEGAQVAAPGASPGTDARLFARWYPPRQEATMSNPSRDDAWRLLTEWTPSEALRKHGLSVEADGRLVRGAPLRRRRARARDVAGRRPPARLRLRTLPRDSPDARRRGTAAAGVPGRGRGGGAGSRRPHGRPACQPAGEDGLRL